jgi:hypothetical protein
MAGRTWRRGLAGRRSGRRSGRRRPRPRPLRSLLLRTQFPAEFRLKAPHAARPRSERRRFIGVAARAVNPAAGAAWTGHGPVFGQITCTGVSTTDGSVPSVVHIPAVSPDMLRSQGIVAGLSGPPDGSGNVQFEGTGHDVAIYGGIPAAPAGWHVQQG